MKNLPNPTEAELEILQTLWQIGPCSVKQVHGLLQEKREVGYTTILKQLQIMLEKKLKSFSKSTGDFKISISCFSNSGNP